MWSAHSVSGEASEGQTPSVFTVSAPRSRSERATLGQRSGHEPDRLHPSELGVTGVAVRMNGKDRDIEATGEFPLRERVFDVEPRGTQEARSTLIDRILGIYPNADVNRLMLRNPRFDNVRWGYTAADSEPRWILIDP